MATKRRTIVAYANPEKQGHGASQDPFVPAPPARVLLVGPPGVGKRSVLLNLLAAMSEEKENRPTRIIVIHADGETVEYEGVADEVRGPDGCPTLEEMTADDVGGRDAHKVVIVDEIPWHNLSKASMSKFERLVNFVSTHATTSVFLCFQQLVAIPTAIRRAFSHNVLFKGVDLPAASGLAERVGMSREAIRELLHEILRDKHDSLMIDLTANPEDPHRLRLNLWTPILPRKD